MHATRPVGTTTLALVAALLASWAVAAHAEITSVAPSFELTYDVKFAGATAAAATVSTAPNAFTVRFGLNLYHYALGPEGHPDDYANGRYTTAFTVLGSGNYDLTVTVHRAGELRREHLDPFVVSCGVDLAAMSAPLLTLNAVEPGPVLDQLTLPGASIPLGSDDAAVELSEGVRSQTISLRNRPTRDDVSLLFEMAAHTTVNTLACEVSSRLGSQAVGSDTTFCPTCGYPGTGNRDINEDGLFVEVEVQDLCGNGGTNPGEECDLGNLNGTAGSCCTATCKFRPQGQTCRPAAGDCDQAEVCSGTDRGCPVDLKKPAVTVCRAAAAGGCDIAELCSGVDNECPPDLRAGDGALCRPADPDALGCDVAEVCVGGVCQPDAKEPSGTPCQPDANPCTNERCDASGQCAHVPVMPVGAICDDGLFCNGDDRCDANGTCSAHLNPPCSGTQTCNEFGDECLTRPPLLVTNADDDGSEGSLGNVMGAANLRAGADTISFDPEFFATPRRITLNSALPAINGDLTIIGPGAGLLTIDGAGVDRVFDVSTGVTAALSGMTITGGNAGDGAGGGIRNAGSLTVSGCHVTGNTAAFGGGIGNELGASLIVERSTISYNTATGVSSGGGIASLNAVIITNSTISGNRATGGVGDNGGGLRLGSATIENSTITDNAAAGPDSAGGLYINVGTVTLRNTIIAANANDTTVPDVAGSGSLSSGGYNLVGNPGGFPVNSTNDLKGTAAAPLDPQLSPLAENGGGVPTHALSVASPALDHGNRFGAIADQRGAARPFDVTSIAGPGDQSDVGAVEMQAVIVTNAADSGAGSLRQVVADAPVGGDVLFDAAFFGVPRTIALNTEIGIARNLAIHGPGADLLTLSGQHRNRIFRVAAGGLHVAMSGLTIAGGLAADGGGILSDGHLTLTACTIADNRAMGTAGGGVLVRGATGTFTGCTFSDNTSGFRGGALELADASGALTNCTISGNRATGFGGGGGISFISSAGAQALAIASSTIVDNAGANAGGIRVAASSSTATLTLRSSIIAGTAGPNLGASPGAGGTTTITSLGYNLSSDDGGGFLGDDTDQTGSDPALGPLQYNGGPTQTHMPRPGSPVIDQGNAAGIATDQRGRARPFDVAGTPAVPGGDNADIGAVEAHAAVVTNDSNDEPGSLRQVIAAAGPDADVWFDPVFFATERIIFLTGEILIGDSLTIQGPGARLIVSGSGSSRVFNIATGTSISISDLHMRDGASSPSGGVIASGGDLALTRCAVESGETDGQGGGVFLTGAVGRFSDSLIAFNHAQFRGAGIGLDGASATLTNCTVSDNVAPSFGGGVSLFTAFGDQTLAVTNCTFAANTATDGSDIRVEAFPNLSATATVRNTILAGSSPTLRVLAGTDATATITSLGYNLSTDTAAGLLDDNTDQIGTDPLIAGPSDNGGATFTYALLPGSPAIDRGASSGSRTDQRGAPRPVDDPAIPNASGGDGADIGAFELALPQPIPTATATRTGSATAVSSTPTATRTGTRPTATATRSGSPAVGTPTATRSGSPSLGTPTPTPTPTATPLADACIGDCDRNGQVTISELVLAVNIALGNTPTAECAAADGNADGTVKISEIIAAVVSALGSCP